MGRITCSQCDGTGLVDEDDEYYDTADDDESD